MTARTTPVSSAEVRTASGLPGHQRLCAQARETFSFNGVVGERTAAKGYKEGGVYVGGETVQQLGGGVCQVASVLYYCTLKSDLEVIARQEHQYVPDYIPWGMDAHDLLGQPRL